MNVKYGYIANRFILLFVATALNAVDGAEPANYLNPDIADAMTFLNGNEVKTASDWKARKAEIKKL